VEARTFVANWVDYFEVEDSDYFHSTEQPPCLTHLHSRYWVYPLYFRLLLDSRWLGATTSLGPAGFSRCFVLS